MEYDGTDYAGFQRQKNRPTVQSQLERALQECLKHETVVIPAGRTDAGVHATGQVCKFRTTNRIPGERIPLALNRLLPPSISVRQAREVSPNFHPRFNAISRVYVYTIDSEPIRSALLRRYAHHVARPLHVPAMQRAARYLIGVHDFASFQASGSEMGGTIREMFRIACARQGRLVRITLEANAFLYQMVRNIVGTLIQIGIGKRHAEDMKRVLEARDRSQAGPTAPPNGLCLVKVKYARVFPKRRSSGKITESD